MQPKKLSKTEINNIVKGAVDDAIDFVESEIALTRIKSQKYFDGEVDIGAEEGRSSVVATKVRDTVRAIKPSLMRICLQTDRPVEYVPSGPKDVGFAELATKYMHYKFNELDGYRVINDAFHDALIKKVGIVKVYWDTKQEVEPYEYRNLNDQEYALLVNDDDVDVVEHSTVMEMDIDMNGMEIQAPRHSLKLNRIKEYGELVIESVPPEEFFVNRSAKRIDDAYVCGHTTEMRVGDLVAMGYDFEEVSKLSGITSSNTTMDTEDYERRGYTTDFGNEEQIEDMSMKLVAVTEAYMKIDVDGTGVPVMHKFLLGGADYKLLDMEAWGDAPFAVFEVDPEPHTFYGRSVADILMNEQDVATMMLRGLVDNVALSNSPQREVVDGQTNIDDLMNNEIGAIIRVKQSGMIRDLAVPFTAGQTLTAMQYFDQEIEAKSGVLKASNGLSPDALQSTTAAAVNATVQAAAGQIEVMARNLAEGGMRRLFKLMLKLMVENVDEEKMMRVAGDIYQPVDPRAWNSSMDVSVNVGLGTGREDQRAAALNQALQLQMQVFQGYGPQNGIVTLTNIRNTLGDLLAIQGVRNADRYFQPMNAQTEQQMMAQRAQQQQAPQLDQAQAYLQAEQIKAQAKAQTDMAKLQIDAQKAIAEDDRQRDQMDADLIMKAAEILGKYGQTVNVARIKQMQDTPRYPQQTPVQAVTGGRF